MSDRPSLDRSPTRCGRRARLAAALLLAAAGTVQADIPPPPGYVETCTAERQCAGQEVDRCSANFRERDVCARRHAGDGYTLACRTRGASVWTELWCRPKPEPKPDARAAPGASAPR
ncbi:MAG: hypothetical protein U1F56_02560 [Rubrivivax sp.]